MRITYIGNRSAKDCNFSEDEDYITLLYDRWNDFSIQTRFPTECRIKGQLLNLGAVKILFEDEDCSSRFLDTLSKDLVWNGDFPIPGGINYVSVPEELEFYKHIVSVAGLETAREVAEILKDASLYNFSKKDEGALKLCASNSFRTSLLRDLSSKRAYSNLWKLFASESIQIGNFSAKTRIGDSEEFEIHYKFLHEILPSNLNILIGPNGTGKTQTLVQLINQLIAPDKDQAIQINANGNIDFGKIVVLSFSPFDSFPIDGLDFKEIEKGATAQSYEYFGFRQRPVAGEKKVDFNLELPKHDTALAIKAMASDDLRYSTLSDWHSKIETASRLLLKAIPSAQKIALFIKDSDEIETPTSYGETYFRDSKGHTFLTVSQENSELIAQISKNNSNSLLLYFFNKDNQPIALSSGQRIFTYMVTLLLGAIDLNTLIMLDEPELFLHPSLEIELIGLINEILEIYDSRAIIATHSIVTAREVPAQAVHVLRRTGEHDEIQCTNPPFQTLGADLQRISSYAFGDRSVSKPHEAWLAKALKKAGDPDTLIDSLKNEINEELIIRIYALSEETK